MTLPHVSRAKRHALVPRVSGATIQAERLLKARVPEQKKTNWCWAAVGLGVMDGYGTSGGASQCSIASRVLGRDCCPYGGGCNKPAHLPPALVPHFASAFDSPAHRTIEFVMQEIDGHRPIAVAISRQHGGAGHAVLITGYRVTTTGTFLWVCDPWKGTRKQWRWEAFLSNYEQNGAWDCSYTTTGGVVGEEMWS